jgi:hypothetical protein
MKWCPAFGRIFPRDVFVRASGRSDPYCDECRDVRVTAWRLNITPAEVKELRTIGSCAICGTTDPWPKGNLYIDHCHETGRVRGVLCCNCNAFLGKANDDPAILRAAVEYLETRTQ